MLQFLCTDPDILPKLAEQERLSRKRQGRVMLPGISLQNAIENRQLVARGRPSTLVTARKHVETEDHLFAAGPFLAQDAHSGKQLRTLLSARVTLEIEKVGKTSSERTIVERERHVPEP